jgi:hypothetical protein
LPSKAGLIEVPFCDFTNAHFWVFASENQVTDQQKKLAEGVLTPTIG